ncbi:MAG TPA: hypothetical protein VHD38_02200 [Candidatus Paceibacterota bacterium]|nr:hypothetical protein [Candidatus Paceibacterota bacterium]
MKSTVRPLIALVGIIGVCFAPPYVSLICMLLLCMRFRAWEVLIIGFFMDMAWLPAASFHIVPLYTLVAIALVWVFEPLRLQLLR